MSAEFILVSSYLVSIDFKKSVDGLKRDEGTELVLRERSSHC